MNPETLRELLEEILVRLQRGDELHRIRQNMYHPSIEDRIRASLSTVPSSR